MDRYYQESVSKPRLFTIGWNFCRPAEENKRLISTVLHTEFKSFDFKCHGHPISGHLEWVEAKMDGDAVQI